jgi:hypothetical protein
MGSWSRVLCFYFSTSSSSFFSCWWLYRFFIFSVNYNINLKVFSSSNICGSFHLRQHDARVGNDTLFRRAHDRIYINGRGNRFDTGMHLLAEQIAAAGVHRLGILTTIRSKKDRSFPMNFSGCDSGLFNPFDFFQLQAPLADQAVEQGAEQVRCGVHRHRMKLALLNPLFQASGSLKKRSSVGASSKINFKIGGGPGKYRSIFSAT